MQTDHLYDCMCVNLIFPSCDSPLESERSISYGSVMKRHRQIFSGRSSSLPI